MYELLEQESLAGKLVLVQPTHAAQNMAVRATHLPGMFMEKMNHVPIRRPGPLIGLSDSSRGIGVVTNGGLISPQSESQKSMSTPPPSNGSPDGLKQIDPSKVCTLRRLTLFHRMLILVVVSPFTSVSSIPVIMIDVLTTLLTENPPPCNEHYLMTCSKGVRFFVHDVW